MKAIVDHDICIGCGLCASISEEVFTMNADGLSEPIADSIADELVEAAEEACSSCP